MASYGEGFAQGMNSGSSLVNGIINMGYKKDRQDRENTLFDQSQTDREQKGQLFKAYQDQYDQVQGLKELGVRNEEQQGLMEQFNNASAGDMTHFIMQNFQANGGKVNDQTYLLASGIGDTLFKTKNEVQKTEQANKLFNLQLQEHQRKLTQPLSNEGKIATDFNMPLTPESISRNPTLFGRPDSATSNMKDFALFQNNPEFAGFLKDKTSSASNLQKEFEFVKSQGFKGSVEDFIKMKNNSEIAQDRMEETKRKNTEMEQLRKKSALQKQFNQDPKSVLGIGTSELSDEDYQAFMSDLNNGEVGTAIKNEKAGFFDKKYKYSPSSGKEDTQARQNTKVSQPVVVNTRDEVISNLKKQGRSDSEISAYLKHKGL